MAVGLGGLVATDGDERPALPPLQHATCLAWVLEDKLDVETDAAREQAAQGGHHPVGPHEGWGAQHQPAGMGRRTGLVGHAAGKVHEPVEQANDLTGATAEVLAVLGGDDAMTGAPEQLTDGLALQVADGL